MDDFFSVSMALGLIAAFAWGVHDFCVRFITQKLEILPTLFIVLATGLVVTTLIATFTVNWATLTLYGAVLAVASGPFFFLACFALYKAFSIGPVRLVAPLIASYPIIFVAGYHVVGIKASLAEWIAVGTILVGISIVAMSPNEEISKTNRNIAATSAILAGLFFAIAFSIGQRAAILGPEMATLVITRATAVLCALVAVLLAGQQIRPILGSSKSSALLILMGTLDALAIGTVIWSSRHLNPEYAVVASSIFGLITIVLARIFLKEKMSIKQWLGVFIVFGGIGCLGF